MSITRQLQLLGLSLKVEDKLIKSSPKEIKIFEVRQVLSKNVILFEVNSQYNPIGEDFIANISELNKGWRVL